MVFWMFVLTSCVWQSIRLQREPYETEIVEEVEKEYQRLEAERAGEEVSPEKSIADMAIRMDELEAKLDASNERLEAKIDASQSRLEAMFQQLLAARPPMHSTPPASPRDTFPAVSVLLPILGDEPRSAAKEKEVSSPKLTPQVGRRASPPVPVAQRTSPRTHLEEMLAGTIVDTFATEAGPSSSVAPEQPVQVLQT
jgi:hypothetical protein